MTQDQGCCRRTMRLSHAPSTRTSLVDWVWGGVGGDAVRQTLRMQIKLERESVSAWEGTYGANIGPTQLCASEIWATIAAVEQTRTVAACSLVFQPAPVGPQPGSEGWPRATGR